MIIRLDADQGYARPQVTDEGQVSLAAFGAWALAAAKWRIGRDLLNAAFWVLLVALRARPLGPVN